MVDTNRHGWVLEANAQGKGGSSYFAFVTNSLTASRAVVGDGIQSYPYIDVNPDPNCMAGAVCNPPANVTCQNTLGELKPGLLHYWNCTHVPQVGEQVLVAGDNPLTTDVIETSYPKMEFDHRIIARLSDTATDQILLGYGATAVTGAVSIGNDSVQRRLVNIAQGLQASDVLIKAQMDDYQPFSARATQLNQINAELTKLEQQIALLEVEVAAKQALDSDRDGINDYADLDNDNDLVLDREDAFPLDKTEWLDTDTDTDTDGIGNNRDDDDDGDGVLDVLDHFPLDASSSVRPTPVVTAAPVVTVTPKPVVIATPAVTATPKPVVTVTPAVTVTPKPVVIATPAVTVTPKPVVTATPAVTVVPTPVVTATPVVTVVPTPQSDKDDAESNQAAGSFGFSWWLLVLAALSWGSGAVRLRSVRR